MFVTARFHSAMSDERFPGSSKHFNGFCFLKVHSLYIDFGFFGAADAVV